jgi:hypothetical protein
LEQIQLEREIAPAFIYVPDRSLAELTTELEQIYQNSADLYNEFSNISTNGRRKWASI